jgi:hypothetical protein
MQIPLLKITTIDYRKKFVSDFSDKEDFFEIAIKKYPNKILDIFEHTLDETNPQIELLSNEYFRLSQEYKYLNFIEEVFNINNSKAYINLPLGSIKHNNIINIMQNMDAIDKNIFLHQVINFHSTKYENFVIDDVNLLKMFLKETLRENLRNDVYFNKKPLLLFSNYDLSLPIMFKNENDIKMYEKIANEHGLYFR